MLGYALRHPYRITSYARRRGRDSLLWLTTRDHVQYYRAVMRSDTARSSDAAVGSKTRESWLKIGQLQFDYLLRHGLKPGARMLEIGCGNLRAGRLFIGYLDAGNYYGVDISPEILLAAQDTVTEFGLQEKLPHLAAGVRDPAVRVLPPHGLCLEEIGYPAAGDFAGRAAMTRRVRPAPGGHKRSQGS